MDDRNHGERMFDDIKKVIIKNRNKREQLLPMNSKEITRHVKGTFKSTKTLLEKHFNISEAFTNQKNCFNKKEESLRVFVLYCIVLMG